MPPGDADAARPAPYAVEEASVRLLVNGEPVAFFHCTPLALEDMVLGWLLAEGLASDAGSIGRIDVDEERLIVSVRLVAEPAGSGVPGGRALGAGGSELPAADIPPGPDRLPAAIARLLSDPETLRALFRSMFDRAVLREAGGGIHTGALVLEGQVRLVVEDVGRHNLVDKIIGLAVRSGLPLRESLVLLSARVSGAIALKLCRTGVPAVATISVPTTMARQIASRCGITMVGRSLKQSPLHYPVSG